MWLRNIIRVITKVRVNIITLKLSVIMNRTARLERRYNRLERKRADLVYKLYH